ncbi:MAG: N-acetylmannosamine-6-phosphate 2-epimerase [Cryobacterium sp.]|uniref:N-acetylmannosamine-6-phosphate 2-epimerase n=1 Tax=unclassified Cryobacterium TaxID=2649013 RepID=UPI0018CB6C41|nr:MULTISPECIES: N-acetylmannosamine-6-phosphate 2-epimerase [unclassified Cryobacterium]MCY7403131.1 N-acetylmannosamine-6-phosphate 2-epimerase [Cryobacterium sp.]MEC5153792.1 N-acylglucosamine-6-phosphate 2-epimerase [Cryobacterium sp. CAN_C3]
MSEHPPDPAPATTTELIDRLRGQLIVSCQAKPGEALYGPDHMVAMALSAIAGGARGLRIEGPDDIRAVRAATTLPIIGLWKIGETDVYITPTLAAAQEILECGADIVALDGTDRLRPDGLSLAETIRRLKADGPVIVLADVSTVDEGRSAAAAGADLVSTTLSGYTAYSRQGPAPDLELVAELTAVLSIPVLAEGRISTPTEARAAFERGASAVVIGSAITRPQVITASFVRQTADVRTKQGHRLD